MIAFLISQQRKRRLKDVESVSQGHEASTGWNAGLNADMSHP